MAVLGKEVVGKGRAAVGRQDLEEAAAAAMGRWICPDPPVVPHRTSRSHLEQGRRPCSDCVRSLSLLQSVAAFLRRRTAHGLP
jgi:hypothetical protein